MPVFLHGRDRPAIGALHFDPETPGGNKQVGNAGAYAFRLQPAANPAGSGLAVGNGEDPHGPECLAEPLDELALLDVLRPTKFGL